MFHSGFLCMTYHVCMATNANFLAKSWKWWAYCSRACIKCNNFSLLRNWFQGKHICTCEGPLPRAMVVHYTPMPNNSTIKFNFVHPFWPMVTLMSLGRGILFEMFPNGGKSHFWSGAGSSVKEGPWIKGIISCSQAKECVLKINGQNAPFCICKVL